MEYSVLTESQLTMNDEVLGEQGEGSRQRGLTQSRVRGTRRVGRPRKRAAAWDHHATIQALETLARLLTPQVMLPIQLKSEPEDLPEFGLLRAVLLSAVADYVDSFKPSPTAEVAQRRREARRIAESWFAGDPGAPLEFDLCCSMYGLSADQMRAKIKQLTKRLSAPWN